MSLSRADDGDPVWVNLQIWTDELLFGVQARYALERHASDALGPVRP